MKILFTADWQAAVTNLDRCHLALDQILDIVAGAKVDYVVHLGDTKEAFALVDVRVNNFLIEATKAILAYCPLFVLQGNHDLLAPRDGVPSGLPVMAAAGAVVIDTPSYQKLPGEVYLTFVPYIRNAAALLKAFSEPGMPIDWRAKGKTRIFAFHAEVSGCKQRLYRKGHGPKLPDGFDLYVGGHIHHQQEFVPNAWYVGSPFCCDWGEANEDKGYLLVEIDKGKVKVKAIPSEIPRWFDPDVPNYHPPKSWKGCQVRVRVPVSKDPNRELAAARTKLTSKYPGATLHVLPTFTTYVTPTMMDTEGSDAQWIEDYLNRLTPPTGITREQVAACLLEALPGGGTLGLQKLTFENVHAQNVLCFKQCELPLNRSGLTLVTGRNEDWGTHRSNGAGKSSLLGLPLLALFGQTPKEQKHDAWARDNTADPAEVLVNFKLADGRCVSVLRGRNPSTLVYHVDGKDLTMGDSNATQRAIEALTGLTWEVLTSSLYIGQQEVNAAFGTDKERKELFSRLLGLERFLEAQKVMRKRLLRWQKVAASTDEEITTLHSLAEEIQKDVVDLERQLSSLPEADPQAVTAAQQKKQTSEAAIRRLRAVNADWTNKAEKLTQRITELATVGGGLTTNLARIREQLTQTSKIRQRCPMCGTSVTGESLQEHTQELKAEQLRLEGELSSYKTDRDVVTAKRLKFLTDRQLNDGEIANLEHTIRAAEMELLQHNLLTTKRASLDEARLQKKDRIQELTAKRAIHELARTAYLADRQFLEFCISVVGRDGLPAYLCSVVTPQLNAAAQRFSEAFTDGEISVEFVVNAGDIDVDVHNLHGGKTIKDQSMGESRMAGLIVAFAFRDVLVPHNILILDEPGEGLDSENAKAFARGLGSVVERFGTVFLTTHNPAILSELEPNFHLEVVKTNGVSEVIEL